MRTEVSAEEGGPPHSAPRVGYHDRDLLWPGIGLLSGRLTIREIGSTPCGHFLVRV